MKLVTIFFLTLAVLGTAKQHHQEKILPMTPKGSGLDNHYGTAKQHDFYGPHTDPITQVKLNGKLYTNNAEEIYLAGGANSNCKMEEQPFYQLCYKLGCDECGSTQHCGWCESTRQCIPGNRGKSSCPSACPSGWAYNSPICTNNVKSGSLSNVAPESEELITPEIKNPTALIKTVEEKNGILKHRQQIGYKVEQKEVSAIYKPTGEITHQKVHVAVPVYGEHDKPVKVMTTHVQEVDLETGKTTDLSTPKEKTTLGTA